MKITTDKSTIALDQFHTELLKGSGVGHQNTDLQRSIHTQMYLNMSRSFKNILKATIIASLLLSGTSFLKPKAALADGGFAQSCTDIRMYYKHASDRGMVFAHCPRRDGRINYMARINLNDHIANNNGELVWQPNGNYRGTCGWSTALEKAEKLDGTVLYTKCKSKDGKIHATGIDLNRRIINDNGDLKYVGQ